MIILVSSPKQHLRKDMQHSVHIFLLKWMKWNFKSSFFLIIRCSRVRAGLNTCSSCNAHLDISIFWANISWSYIHTSLRSFQSVWSFVLATSKPEQKTKDTENSLYIVILFSYTIFLLWFACNLLHASFNWYQPYF